MIAGHFGFAAAVKSRARATPLWALMLACQWLDVVFVPLLLAGVERLEPVPGSKPGAYGESIIHADYTHSLVGALVLSVVFGALALLLFDRRSAVVLGLVAFSHWLLDVLMHRADMPLLPGAPASALRLGFGLWRWPAASALLELLLVVVGGVLYWRAAREAAAGDGVQVRRANRCGVAVLAVGVLVLGLNLAGA